MPLTPKAVETLLALVERRGEIVGKEELMRAIWQGAVVEESNLSQYLHILRKTLGKRRDGTPFIETFKRRGYRFNGAVSLTEIPALQNGGNADSPASQSAFVPAGNQIKPRARSYRYFYAGAAFVCAFLLAAFSFYRFNSAVTGGTKPKSEISFLHLTNGNEVSVATISPDGKYFVYHEQDSETSRLWLQQTGQANRIELVPTSTRKFYGKAFSPDSQFVYFVAEDAPGALRTLYRVPVIGGPETKILTDIYSSPSFSPGGKEIVFLRRNADENLLIAAAAGGSNERVLLRRSGKNIISGDGGAWSPDGSLIAFGALDHENLAQGACTISALEVETGKIKTLSPEKWENCYRMAWTQGGDGLIFIGTKANEAYSTRRDQIFYLSYPSGEARRLTTDGSRHQVSSLGVTDKNEILAVPFNRSSQIWAMDARGDTRTAVQITTGLADGRAGLAPLPDGRVGYLARTGDGFSVWLMNADGSESRQINGDEPNSDELRATPDGRFFVFSLKRDGKNHLYRINTDGTNLQQLTFGESIEVDSTVSPDGKWLVYPSAAFDGESWRDSLRKTPVEGGEPVLVTDKYLGAPHFSPDGKFISGVSPGNEILVLRTDDGSLVKKFKTAETPTLNVGARWTADGKNLVYIVQRKNVSNLWLQPVNGGEPRPLTDFTSGDIYNFAFSTDGTRLYIARGYQIRNAVLIKNFIN